MPHLTSVSKLLQTCGVPENFKTYLVTNVPLSVWKRMRARAEREKISIKDLFRRWIQHYAEGK